MIRPGTGFTIALRCALFMRGGKNPFVVELTSSNAEFSGVVVPIPTLCENESVFAKKKQQKLSAALVY